MLGANGIAPSKAASTIVSPKASDFEVDSTTLAFTIYLYGLLLKPNNSILFMFLHLDQYRKV
ncbi:hypothetical protein WP50_24745 [Lactiplantibacillus plantarum]|nr:hypothetical protein WP50_24745 [Lactiplantibacillus plantarum]